MFSACVTTFIVEGYQYLQNNSSNTTNALLTQLLLVQLASITNNSPVNASTLALNQPPFQPAPSAVRFNALWFLSLAFSLACALSATLVQQWTRQYVQAVERHSAPRHRARIRSYLYEGIITFKMTAVVEAIPILLHISVFLFFAGLVEFLMTINQTIANITLVAVAVCGAVYILLTILPLMYRQCPYRTPLSGILWRMFQLYHLLRFRVLSGARRGNLADSREHLAMGGTPGTRDRTALQWVLESLTQNRTLEAFVDGIPGFFHSDRRDLGYDPCDVFDAFLRNSPIQLGSKIGKLLKSCSSGALTKAVSQRRAFICLNAISTLTLRLSDKSVSAWMQSAWAGGFVDCIAEELQRLKMDDSPIMSTYAHYTSVLMTYKWQREFLVAAMKDMDISEHGRRQCPSTPSGSPPQRLSVLLSVLEKLGAVQSLEEATDLKIMPARGSGDTAELMTNVWELRKMLQSQPSPSLMARKILGMNRVASLIQFIKTLQQSPPMTDEAQSMAFDILCVISGQYGGMLKGSQDRLDLLATPDEKQLLVVQAVGEVIDSVHNNDGPSRLSPRICDVLVWLLASMGGPSVMDEANRIHRTYQLSQPGSLAVRLALELRKLRAGGLSPDDSIKWMDYYQEKIWPESDGCRHI